MTHSSSTPDPFDDRFQRVVEASPAGVIVVDEQCRILLVNRQIETWFQYPRTELVGQFIEVLVPDSIRPQHVDLRNGYMAAPVDRPIGSGRDLHARRRDGSEFPCDVSLHPLPSAIGMQVMVHIVDTTERRRLDAVKREQESIRQLRFMVDNLPAGAVYVSESGIAMNRAVEAITGYACQELPTVAEWFRKLFGDRSAELLEQYLADQQAGFPQPRLLELTRHDGQSRWVQMAAYRDGPHELWLLHDVTEQRTAQARLVQGERLAAIGQMMTALAHESRNALQRAQACLEMMQLDLDGQPDLLGLAQRTQLALDELERLYEEVRGYAAPLKLELVPSNLSHLCTQVWTHLATIRGDKDIRLELHCAPEEIAWTIDPHRVAQVLRNILENAISVLPRTGGQIAIRCRLVNTPDTARLQLAIHDNGPGLSPEQRRRIFEPFYTTKARGTGLGMAIAQRIMEAHGGRIFVGERAPGTEIVLEFPHPPLAAT